jgi:hypothetical protein
MTDLVMYKICAFFWRNKAMGEKPQDKGRTRTANPPEAFDHIHNAIHGLQFGEVTVIVQNGVVVQVDRTERKRFGRFAKVNQTS